MENIVIAVILIGIIGGVIWYLYKAKKSGKTCVGCPHAKQCAGKCGGCCDRTHKNTENSHK